MYIEKKIGDLCNDLIKAKYSSRKKVNGKWVYQYGESSKRVAAPKKESGTYTSARFPSDEKKIKYIKRGKIITFKKKFNFMGNESKQVLVERFDKRNFKIEGMHKDTPSFGSMEKLLAAIDWGFIDGANDFDKSEGSDMFVISKTTGDLCNDLIKAKKASVGEIRVRKDGHSYKKVSEGKWERVAGGGAKSPKESSHPFEGKVIFLSLGDSMGNGYTLRYDGRGAPVAFGSGGGLPHSLSNFTYGIPNIGGHGYQDKKALVKKIFKDAWASSKTREEFARKVSAGMHLTLENVDKFKKPWEKAILKDKNVHGDWEALKVKSMSNKYDDEELEGKIDEWREKESIAKTKLRGVDSSDTRNKERAKKNLKERIEESQKLIRLYRVAHKLVTGDF